jgi:hypothetical protein
MGRSRGVRIKEGRSYILSRLYWEGMYADFALLGWVIRKFKHVKDEVEMCNSYASTKACNFGEKSVPLPYQYPEQLERVRRLPCSTRSATVCCCRCNKSHSLPIYLANKGPDIIFPPSSSLSSLPPYIHLDPSNLPPIVCPTFSEIGYCPQGFKCRFLAAHVTRKEGAAEEDVGELVEEEGGEKRKRHEAKFGIRGERNWVDIAPVKALRQNSVRCFPFRFILSFPSPLQQ